MSSHQPRLPLIYSGRVRKALQLAERAHRGVSRKSGDHPYLLHPVAVATVLSAVGADDDLLCAAYLHDAVEDTRLSLLEIEDEFGSRVARLVSGVTKPREDARGQPLSSRQQDQQALETMEHADADLAALKAADLIANISDLVLDHREQGVQHWQRMFGERLDFKIAHYLRLAETLEQRLASLESYPPLQGYLSERAGQLRTMHAEDANPTRRS